MKILSFLFIAVVGTVAFGQDYKWKYANTLSTQYRYAEALPVWEEISQKAMTDGIRLTPSLRKTVEALTSQKTMQKQCVGLRSWFQKDRPNHAIG